MEQLHQHHMSDCHRIMGHTLPYLPHNSHRLNLLDGFRLLKTSHNHSKVMALRRGSSNLLRRQDMMTSMEGTGRRRITDHRRSSRHNRGVTMGISSNRAEEGRDTVLRVYPPAVVGECESCACPQHLTRAQG